MASSCAIFAQPLSTVTGLRLYEHHSSSMNNGAAFGSGANGAQSGYDFVNKTYYNSFDSATFGAYSGGQEANIDMVEHNGGFGNGSDFGFTSGVSSIWGGDIKGNGTTRWIEAPASFNYATVNNVSAVIAAFDSTAATPSVAAVGENKIYLARIRNSDLYVAMRCYNVHNASSPGGVQDVYFDFEYKYGTYAAPTGITETSSADKGLTLYPNPAREKVSMRNNSGEAALIQVYTVLGEQVSSFTLDRNSTRDLDMHSWNKGIYLVISNTDNGKRHMQRLVRQ